MRNFHFQEFLFKKGFISGITEDFDGCFGGGLCRYGGTPVNIENVGLGFEEFGSIYKK